MLFSRREIIVYCTVYIEYQRSRESQRNVVYLGWPIALSYMSPNAEGRGNCGVSANEYSCSHGAQIIFGDPTQYLTYESVCPFVGITVGSPPPPPQARVTPPWTQKGEEQHFLEGERVGWPIRTTGKKALHSVYSVSYHVHHSYKQ